MLKWGEGAKKSFLEGGQEFFVVYLCVALFSQGKQKLRFTQLSKIKSLGVAKLSSANLYNVC